jgi:Uma2 family endonuclease
MCSMLARELAEHDDTPVGDGIVVLRNATWEDYERLLEMRGYSSVPRIAYLEGEIEIMSPSKDHEVITSLIGRLLEVWCEEHEIDYMPVRSWTLKDEAGRKAGLEPDECYVFGPVTKAERPDLAIEVVWTSGGVQKLDIYRKLAVPEVWFWQRGKIIVQALRGAEYEQVSESKVVPGIDLVELAQFLDRPTANQAKREYRAALQARR